MIWSLLHVAFSWQMLGMLYIPGAMLAAATYYEHLYYEPYPWSRRPRQPRRWFMRRPPTYVVPYDWAIEGL